MKKNKHSTLTLAALLALSLPIMGVAEDKDAMPGVPQKSGGQSQGSDQGALPEVVIKGGERTGVQGEKPPLEVELNPNEAVLPAMEIEEELLGRQPESLRSPRAGFSQYLANPRTVVPGRIRLARDPVKVFYPLREIMAISPSFSQEIGTGWEMAVTDTSGRPFRKFSGRGLPPASIPWNGRSDRGEIVGVGKNYSPVITYKDIRGQTRNFVGEPFAFDGVLHQESRGLIISLALPALFEPKKGSSEEIIGQSGTDLLAESADWIKRYFFTYPIRIECHGKDASLSGQRAKAASKVLGSMLLLHTGEIPSTGNLADAGVERLDIIIANR